MKIIPSIIAKNQKEFDERISKVSFARLIQLDVMDGKFVKNSSLQFDLELPRKNYEAHLMLKSPREWIKLNSGFVKSIIFHYESVSEKEIPKLITSIKRRKKKVGIAINPNTSPEKIFPYLNRIDKVLVMTVEPGKYGAEFLPKTLEKIHRIKQQNKKTTIQVDGGIDNKTLPKAKKSGAQEFVVGSYLQKSKNKEEVKRRVERMKK